LIWDNYAAFLLFFIFRLLLVSQKLSSFLNTQFLAFFKLKHWINTKYEKVTFSILIFSYTCAKISIHCAFLNVNEHLRMSERGWMKGHPSFEWRIHWNCCLHILIIINSSLCKLKGIYVQIKKWMECLQKNKWRICLLI
jgi:hypothetical protein